MTRLPHLVVGALIVAVFLNVDVADAQHSHVDQFGPVDTVEMIFYPFLPSGEMIDSTGPWHGSITVQNVDDADVRIWVFPDAGFEPDQALGTYVLPPNGAITLSSASLGLQDAGAPVVIAGMYRSIWDAETDLVEDAINEACGVSMTGQHGADGWFATCKPSIAGIARLTAPEPPSGATGNRTSEAHLTVDGYNAIPAQDVAWGSQSAFCDAIVANWPDDCSGIGTYEPLGYGVGFVFDGHSYLPLVQTNSGWNTELRISNIDPSVWGGQVNVTLIPSSEDGHEGAADDTITFERVLLPGESWALDLRANGVPDGWVGSAHITSNVGVVAHAARVKPSDDMLMINVAAPSTWATTSPGGELQSATGTSEFEQFTSPFQMHAPLIFRDYFGWNTGISIANIDEASNRVTITWYDAGGSTRGVDARTIPAQGQVYVYIPSSADQLTEDLTGWIGSVTISADAPFHATVDQVKYETGEAMSYMATAAGARAAGDPEAPQYAAESLALPLLQKGRTDGAGDTSGIQLFNPGLAGPVEVEVRYYSQVGDLMPPTNYAPIRTTIGPGGHYTIYTMNQSGMIPESTGVARVEVTGGTGQLFGVSNAVNYRVQGDGSTAFNLVNSFGQYRFPVSQTELP